MPTLLTLSLLLAQAANPAASAASPPDGGARTSPRAGVQPGAEFPELASAALASAGLGERPTTTSPLRCRELEPFEPEARDILLDAFAEDDAIRAHDGLAAQADGGLRYTADLDDAELQRRWLEDPASLGSMALGVPEAGRLVNGVQLRSGEHLVVVDPSKAWGTQETIDGLRAAAQAVALAHPESGPLRVNHLSAREGGHLRPHRSHQAGLDADLGFYYQAGVDPRVIRLAREKAMDLESNWALVKALVTETDVQVILLDRRVQKALFDFALRQGEPRAWLDDLFNAGYRSLFQHARGHRDHFHVRFYAPRSQELGRRIQPLLAKRAEQNIAMHRITKGDTLAGIARRYGSTVALVSRANPGAGGVLRVGRTLRIPLQGPCTRCPVPPPLVIPARRLPPPDPSA